MANTFKWNPSELDRKIEAAVAKIGQRGTTQEVVRTTAVIAVRGPVLDAVELPRRCSMNGNLYMSRYVLVNGVLRYVQSIRWYRGINEVKYLSGASVTVPGSQIGEEQCPWCRAVGWGALRCGRCGSLVCWGKTVGDWMRCYCGDEGRLITESFDEQGVIPQP